jgi:hypothetical protein
MSPSSNSAVRTEGDRAETGLSELIHTVQTHMIKCVEEGLYCWIREEDKED